MQSKTKSSPEIIIIHGYGINIQSAFSSPEGSNAGFTAFDELLESGKAKIFRWDPSWNFSFPQSLNPFNMIKVYTEERKLLNDESFFINLHHFLNKHQPKILFAHSMGAEIILKYMELHNPPTSINRIITTQADMGSYKTDIHKKLAERIRAGELVWGNYYCWWDPALFVSSILHAKPRAGLLGCWNSLVMNKFYPLYLTYNLHTSTINDKKFLKNLRLDL
jgi:hypothetical protein